MKNCIREFKYEPYNAKICDSMIQLKKNWRENYLLKMFHQNIRSLSKNFEQLQVYLKQTDEKLLIIMLTETWKINCLDLYVLDNYDVLYSKGEYNQNVEVVIYISKKIWLATEK